MADRVQALSIVVPVYNSEATLAALIDELERELPSVCEAYEIILVNDGSRDKSWAVIESLTETHPTVRGMSLMRNYGQHNALLAGIRAAQHAIVVTLDDDLQHPPREIKKLLAELAHGHDVVYGVPEREKHNLWRALASQATKMVLQGAMGAEIARNISAFRAFRTEVRQAFARYEGPYVSIDVMLTWGTTRFSAVRVAHEPRRAGVSNYTVGKLIVHAINLVTGFSVLPLQLASIIGFGFASFGLVVLAYILSALFIYGRPVPGFAFLASIVAIFSGAQLFSIGVIGEYLARVHFRLLDKPPYVIRSDSAKRDPP
jgi:undecaprenyl-phosphate 4-deoxy-4-formamido-L-arabinose transferase